MVERLYCTDNKSSDQCEKYSEFRRIKIILEDLDKEIDELTKIRSNPKSYNLDLIEKKIYALMSIKIMLEKIKGYENLIKKNKNELMRNEP